MSDPVPANLEHLLETHHADAWNWARLCCEGGVPAEDVLQMAYARILGGKALFLGRSSFKTWLLGVIRWVAHEERRKRLSFGQRHRELSDAEDVEDASPAPDASLEARDQAAAVLALLDALPQRQRQILHLVFYQELTIEQAAEALAISAGSARQHYERAKASIRRRWQPDDDTYIPGKP